MGKKKKRMATELERDVCLAPGALGVPLPRRGALCGGVVSQRSTDSPLFRILGQTVRNWFLQFSLPSSLSFPWPQSLSSLFREGNGSLSEVLQYSWPGKLPTPIHHFHPPPPLPEKSCWVTSPLMWLPLLPLTWLCGLLWGPVHSHLWAQRNWSLGCPDALCRGTFLVMDVWLVVNQRRENKGTTQAIKMLTSLRPSKFQYYHNLLKGHNNPIKLNHFYSSVHSAAFLNCDDVNHFSCLEGASYLSLWALVLPRFGMLHL